MNASRVLYPRLKKSKGKNPWISRETLQMKRRLKRLKKRLTNNQTLFGKQEILNLSSQIKHQVATDKKRYYGESLPSFITTSPEKFWRSISPHSTECDTLEVDRCLTHDSKKIAHAFNNHFKSVFTQDNGTLPVFNTSLPPMSNVIVTESGIFNLLLRLDVKKSSGPDDIPNSFLNRYAEWVSKYLHVIFSKSLQEGEIPRDWGTARVKPVHKTGNKKCVKNYRPISLTCTVCKILEHIIYNHICEFLDNHSVLTKCQHGFRKGYSTSTQLKQYTTLQNQ